MKAIIASIRLFLAIAWREWEPPGTIPEIYRVHHRISIGEAWGIARRVCE